MSHVISDESIKLAVELINDRSTWADKESAHISADHILLMILPKEIVDAYLKIERRYS
jgi:hypothetical protein